MESCLNFPDKYDDHFSLSFEEFSKVAVVERFDGNPFFQRKGNKNSYRQNVKNDLYCQHYTELNATET